MYLLLCFCIFLISTSRCVNLSGTCCCLVGWPVVAAGNCLVFVSANYEVLGGIVVGGTGSQRFGSLGFTVRHVYFGHVWTVHTASSNRLYDGVGRVVLVADKLWSVVDNLWLVVDNWAPVVDNFEWRLVGGCLRCADGMCGIFWWFGVSGASIPTTYPSWFFCRRCMFLNSSSRSISVSRTGKSQNGSKWFRREPYKTFLRAYYRQNWNPPNNNIGQWHKIYMQKIQNLPPREVYPISTHRTLYFIRKPHWTKYPSLQSHDCTTRGKFTANLGRHTPSTPA